MKTLIGTKMAVRKLGLVTSIITLAGGFSANAANLLIVNESYEPPTLATPGGWEGGVIQDLSRHYVSEGVGGSMALQISATFPGEDYASVYSALFQSGVMGGNEWATRANTVLSFDIKIDSPGLSYVGIFLDAFAEYAWNYGDIPNGTFSGAIAGVDLGAYTPGVFKRIVMPLDDPSWFQITEWPDPALAPWFDPSARTYNNITLVVDSTCLPVPGSFKVTVDNVKVTTKNAMIPFNGSGTGEVAYGPDGYVVTMHGVAEHLGSFEQVSLLPYAWAPGSFELTAANGDKLLGSIHPADLGARIEGGTGRFARAVGSYRGMMTWDDDANFTFKFWGGITSVGSK